MRWLLSLFNFLGSLSSFIDYLKDKMKEAEAEDKYKHELEAEINEKLNDAHHIYINPVDDEFLLPPEKRKPKN